MSLIKLEVADYVAVVTLNNPPVNAQPMELIQQLIAVFDTFNDREDVRCVVLTGEGKCFSAGAELKNRMDLSEPGARWARNRWVREVGYCIADNSKPTIAAVNGPALGAGLGLVSACDIIVASERAVFGLPDEHWGEAVTAAVIARPGATVTEAELIEFCRDRLPGFKAPKRIHFRNSLPISAANKILKRDLKAEYAPAAKAG